MARKRYSPQKKQEQVSRKQFETFLEQHEWITESIHTDLGEDIFVRIFSDGVSTGLSLYVQLKSVKSIVDHQLSTGEISYDFDVDDLGHWEVQTPLVVLVIWDVGQSAGWWMSVKDAIKYLDQHHPNWRNNMYGTVRIPMGNRIDDNGLERIRDILINLYGPVIARDKEITINAKFLFPPTPEGQEKYEALKRSIAAGAEIELEGQYIQEFILPEWWTRIYGSPDPKEMTVWIGTAPSDEILPMQIEFQSNGNAPVRIPYVEFQRVKQGFEEITVSNKHQNSPIRFTMVVQSKTGTCTFTMESNYVGLDGQSANQLINIEKIYAAGGLVQITNLKSQKDLQIPIPPGTCPEPESNLAQFVKNLATIQQKTGKALKIPEFHTLTLGQVRKAHTLATIVTTGRYIRTTDHLFIEVFKPGIALLLNNFPGTDTVYAQIGYKEISYDLFAEHFSLGPYIRTIQGKLADSYDEISKWYEEAADEDSCKVQLLKPKITDEYKNWQPSTASE